MAPLAASAAEGESLTQGSGASEASELQKLVTPGLWSHLAARTVNATGTDLRLSFESAPQAGLATPVGMPASGLLPTVRGGCGHPRARVTLCVCVRAQHVAACVPNCPVFV